MIKTPTRLKGQKLMDPQDDQNRALHEALIDIHDPTMNFNDPIHVNHDSSSQTHKTTPDSQDPQHRSYTPHHDSHNSSPPTTTFENQDDNSNKRCFGYIDTRDTFCLNLFKIIGMILFGLPVLIIYLMYLSITKCFCPCLENSIEPCIANIQRCASAILSSISKCVNGIYQCFMY